MKPYLVDEADLGSGAIIKREVDSAWLHQELLVSAERMRSGVADNLDVYNASRNTTGAFMHQDVQTVFYELIGASRRYANVGEKRLAILSAANVLATDYT